VIVSRSDKRPLIVRVQSLPALLSDVFGRARALVRFFDVDRMARSAPEVLRKVLGLTEAEARLANELASGNSIEQTAGRFGISKETARTQLKAVFRKTDCRSQADLVGLIGRVPPAP
jgi:DNA-binding CsgD family transcriptional regulator